ncbi:hypothetical protein BDF22DRAFT_480066 [Syncephalis plumigaleata]|nr:hypothetical protein BDF22DRAFT_480066 [Syncephalis plumigaleata]
MDVEQVSTTNTTESAACLVTASINSDDMNENDDYFDDDDTLDFDAMASALEITEQNFLSQQQHQYQHQQQQQQQDHHQQQDDVSTLNNYERIMDTYNDEMAPTQTLRIPMTQPGPNPLEINILQKDGEISILRQKLQQTMDQLAGLQQEMMMIKETTQQERQQREREFYREKSGLEAQLQFAKLEQNAQSMDSKSLPRHVNEIRSNLHEFHSVYRKEPPLNAPSTIMAMAHTTTDTAANTANTNTIEADEHCVQPVASSLLPSSPTSPTSSPLADHPNMTPYRQCWRHFQSLKYL